MQTTFSRIVKVMAGPLAIAFLAFGLEVSGDQNDDKDKSRNSRQASASEGSSDSSGSNRDDERSDDRSDRGRQNDQHHKALGVTLNEDSAGNLFIQRIVRDSPAEDAGLRKGDEILTVDGHRVNHTNGLKRALARAEDDTIELGILRNGRHQTIKATLGDTNDVFGSDSEMSGRRSQRNNQNSGEDSRFANAGRSNRRSNSFAGDNRNSERMNYHRGAVLGVALDQGPRNGAWVTDVFPDSPADESGMRAGDQIVAIDGTDISSAEEVMHTISQKQAGDRITLDIDRDGHKKSIKAKLVRHEDLASSEGRMGRMEQSRRNRGYGYDGSGNQSDDRDDNDDGSNSEDDRDSRRNDDR